MRPNDDFGSGLRSGEPQSDHPSIIRSFVERMGEDFYKDGRRIGDEAVTYHDQECADVRRS